MNQTKKRIIKKTITLYNKEGSNVPIKKIISNANVSNGSFFHFFEKKDKVFEEMFLYIKDNFKKSIDIGYSINDDDDFIERVESLFISLINWGTENIEYFIFLLKFKNNLKEEELLEDSNILFYTLNKFIEIGIIQGYFKKIDSILLTKISVSTIAQIIFYLDDHKNENKKDYFMLFLDFIKKSDINNNSLSYEEPEFV